MKKAAWLLGLALVACKKEAAEPVVAETEKAAIAEPGDTIYAASAHLRIVDARTGAVKGIDLQKAIRTVAFTRDGSRAFVAASDGVRELDTGKQEITKQLTAHPARNVAISEDGKELWVLEHQVIVHADETREILPFHLVRIDLANGAVIRNEEIGQRVVWAHPPAKDRYGVVAFETGEIRRIKPGAKLSSDGEAIDPILLGGRGRVQAGVVHGGKVYLPVEAEIARIVEIDLARGEAAAIVLGRPYTLRGIAFAGDRMLANAGLFLVAVDMKTRAPVAELSLGAAHTGIGLSSDGRFAYLAQTIDGTGGSVTAVALDSFSVAKRIHLADISPWALAVRP